ncbi:RNA methyltransferase [Candidatus Woesearchaeota archaeon CG_4_10_14_0_8_um_filter_47_5]|nr:MAG: RNA methyltransferase [Candidatus Woesearchaeota archaeon CG_4_10_14_0_8_um_filter_47_5]
MIVPVLIEPEQAGNVGAFCRVMKNFGLARLVVVSPLCDLKSPEAVQRAKHAQEILSEAEIKDRSVLQEFDYLVGTTGNLGTDYNITRCPLTPEQFAEKCARLSKSPKNSVGLVFGREGSGLTNEELRSCDMVVTIPTAREYGTMNLSHAAAVIFYELFKHQHTRGKTPTISSHIAPISSREKEVMLVQVDAILDKLAFATPEKKETQKRVWKRLVGKSMMSKREAFALLGFLKKVGEKLGKEQG